MHPGEDGGIRVGGADGFQKGLGAQAGEGEEAGVERATVVVFPGRAGEVGAGLVDQAGEVNVAAERDARAAGRVDTEIGSGEVNVHGRGRVRR